MSELGNLEEKTKEELIKIAQDLELEGRSTMKKDELVQSLAEHPEVAEHPAVQADASSEAEAAIAAGNPTPEDTANADTTSEGFEERKDAVEEQAPVTADLAADELDAQGPLHLQSPEERIMTGAVSGEQAKEQEKLLADKPDSHVGEVTESGYNDKGDVHPVSVTEPVMQYAIDYKESALEAAKNSSGDTDDA